MGLTAMSQEYQKTKEEGTLMKIYQYIINQWYVNTGNLCGTYYDVSELATKYGIPKEMITLYMRDTVLNSKLWDKDKQEQMVQGLLGEQLMWAMEDRMEIVNQVNLLKRSQGGKYTPFITAEVNKAMKLRLEASTSLQSIVRGLTGGGTYNIFNQFNQQNNTTNLEQNNYITIEQAREIIQESSRLEDRSEEAKYLEAKYDIEALPEVCATKQTGIDTSKEGLTLNKAEIESIVGDYKGAIEISSKEHHEIRREIEERIGQDEEDPELDIYEDPMPDEEVSISSQYLMPQ
jgi:hypothetical protein